MVQKQDISHIALSFLYTMRRGRKEEDEVIVIYVDQALLT